MNKPTKYRLGPDVANDQGLYDSQGRLIDDSYVDAAVEDAIAQVRGRGRPSLSASGESPLLRVRLSRELATPSVVRPSAPALPDRNGSAVSSTTQRTGQADTFNPTAGPVTFVPETVPRWPSGFWSGLQRGATSQNRY